MTPSLLLTPLAPTPDTARPEHSLAGSPAYAAGLGTSESYDAYDAYRAPPNRSLACQWTGAPIRAIVPLPRRKGHAAQDEKRVSALGASSPTPTPTPAPSTALRHHRSRLPTSVWDGEHDWDVRAEGSDNDDDDEATAARHCSYESITAAEGLAGWSFEELRVECYAQSLVARGTKPPPVVRPSLAIPPAFVPRIVPRYS